MFAIERQKIRFNWNLPLNGNECPLLADEYLTSPVFYLNEIKRPGYCFKLCLRRQDSEVEEIGLLFCRIGEDKAINAKFECVLSKRQWSKAQDYKYQFPENSKAFNSCDKGSFTARVVERGETSLDLICAFEPVSENEDLEDLSHSFASLLETHVFSDCSLYSATGEEHKAHKAILEFRCPKLVRETNANSDSGERMSERAIQILLHYLYSGKLNTYNIPEELGTLVKKLDLLPFYRLLGKFPNEITVKTVVENHIFDFSWAVGRFFNRKGTYYYTVTEGKPFTWLKVILSVKKVKTKLRQELMIHRICNQTKIFIFCKINANMANGRICEMGQYEHFFNNGKKNWILTLRPQSDFSHPRQKEIPQSDILKLNFEISISKGDHSTRIVNIGMSNESNFASKTNLYALGQDLKRLYDNRLYCDVELRAQGKTFPAHKAILSVWSHVFYNMFGSNFTEGQSGKVDITDIKASAIRSMLSYMYSGQTKPLKFAEARCLYYTADKYQILPLRKKCSKLLKSCLDFSNIGEIQKFADAHSEQELEQSAFEFPCRNPKKALNSEIFNDFMEKNPEFSFEAFRAGLKILATEC